VSPGRKMGGDQIPEDKGEQGPSRQKDRHVTGREPGASEELERRLEARGTWCF